MKSYSAKGVVLGNYWGGGQGSFLARKYTAGTKEDLISLIEQALKDGSLDSGMGYESLIGALMIIKETETLIIKEKDYIHTEEENEFFGDLTEEQQTFLEEALFNY